MGAQEHVRERKSAQTEGTTTETIPNPEETEKGRELKEKMDGLVDQIDDIMEENAEQFLKNFVQRGGE
jgi:ubiquitin-like protein Pup